MTNPSKSEIVIAPPFAPIGLGPAKWMLVEPGIFDYPPEAGRPATLIGSRCKVCDRAFFPKRALCPDCVDEGEMVTHRLGTRGTVYCSTIVRVPSPVGIQPPYAYGYVDVVPDNLRVFGLFADADLGVFTPGTEVELVIEPFMVTKQGQQVIGYRFKRAA